MNTLKSILNFSDSPRLDQVFANAASEIMRFWLIQKGSVRYDIYEVEFFLYSDRLNHKDPYVTQSKTQLTFGRWLFHLGGVEISIGSKDVFASVQIRSVRNKETGAFYNGPQRVFREIFEDGGNILEPDFSVKLLKKNDRELAGIIAAPRVGLNLTEFSEDIEDRIDFMLRPYRFVCQGIDDFADKYVAFLYSEKIAKQKHDWPLELAIYKKYLKAFEVGHSATNYTMVWDERSKSLRMARLIGWLAKNQQAMQPLAEADMITEKSQKK